MDKTKPMNLVFILSDEHSIHTLGCYGNPVVQTPNLDKLAMQGVRFDNAYCNFPICVPSRASFSTGRYAHEIGSWDNSFPYTGQEAQSWGHRLSSQGRDVITIGKLHYRFDDDENGFPDIRISLNVEGGTGDIFGLIREDMPIREGPRNTLLNAGPGETSYIRYDRSITEEAKKFLETEGIDKDKPWVLFIGFVTPHFPLVVPEEYYNLYPLENVLFPKQYSLEERTMHPVMDRTRKIKSWDDELDEMTVRKAVAAYYGLCTFMDEQVGVILDTLQETGLIDNTRILYTSDHGDTLGDHGIWYKSTMYEGSVGVPMILAGPDLAKGKIVESPVSLVDLFPTILDATGTVPAEEDSDLPGMSLLSVAKSDEFIERTIFSEYHATGSENAYYMLCNGRLKYIYYVGGYPAQLFDLINDPDEMNDLSSLPEYQEILDAFEGELRCILDPEKTDSEAKAEQRKKLNMYGGRESVLKNHKHIVYSPVPEEFR